MHLRKKYSLKCIIKNHPKPRNFNSHKKNNAEFVIQNDTILTDLFLFFKSYNIDVDFTNLLNHQIPKKTAIKNVWNFIPERKEVNEVFKSLKMISALRTTHIYSDIDWINRIYKKTIKIASTKDEKIKIIESINEVKKTNARFTDSDVKALQDLIEQKKQHE